MKYLLLLCLIVGCTNSPNGAIEFKTTIYYIDGKFHDEIPEDYIFKTWGYRIVDPIGTEHTYRTKVQIPHGRKGKKWCTIHRQLEVIKAHITPKGDGYLYLDLDIRRVFSGETVTRLG